MLKPFKMPSIFQILKSTLILICFPLKSYSPIRLMRIPINKQFEEPFKAIPYIKKYIQHLLHLCSMYALMIYCLLIYLTVFPTEQNAKDIHSLISFKWNILVYYYLHAFIT